MNTIRNIAVFYTGGTIGMKPTAEGLAPATDLHDLAAPLFQEFSHQLHCDWFVSTPLIDSSSVTLENWQHWLNWLDQQQNHYDGFLILHGTDTLAYSANIIALARPDFAKPIILTGALWPFSQPDSDAPLNLRTALAAFALSFDQTAIAFNGKLWRAVGSTKISTQCADGFQTPHFAPLAHWSAKKGWYNQQLPAQIKPEQPSCQACNLHPEVKIHCFTLTPGANIDMITASLNQHTPDGVVLQTYGNGNAPDNAALLQALKQLNKQNIPVLNISQVLQGQVSDTYAQGQALQSSGVINAGQCNLETAQALLTLAASNHWPRQKIIQCLQQHQLI
ncbi:asparaginase [Neisseriaceae bacterium ESL0693]|nr:asparaginase [Neisseriaceae bacterium ESL0693]